MRLPIKLNLNYWPKALKKIWASEVDPRILCGDNVNEISFVNAVSVFKFGKTFKTTIDWRFPLTINALNYLVCNDLPIILDIGASDGTTSLNVMKSVPYAKFYVTDLNIEVFFKSFGGMTWFYDNNGSCILAVNDKFIIYADIDNAIFPFDKISQLLIKKGGKINGLSSKILLINPLLLSLKDKRNIIQKYDIFDVWPNEKVDVVIAANILNQGYFDDNKIIQALKNMTFALNENALIAIIDNRPDEQSTIFKYNEKKMRLVKRINGGTDIEALVLANLG